MYKAKNGQSGGSNKRTGKSGEDLIIQVPCGTIIKSIESKSIIKDLVKEDESHVICQGGIGGKGNFHFKSSTQQTPRFAQEGVKGQKLSIELELKVLADVGLVGLPNAGKSTLLSVMTTAKPKIADYPFTTLQPHLGIVKYGEYQSFVMADIPGLIEGASKGKGLGHQFLKHIERNKILLFLIDIEEKNPNEVYNQLLDELVNFNKDLIDKDRIVVRTKIDTISEDVDERWSSFSEEFIDISSVSNTGLNSLKDKLVSFLSA
jgi:GTP-binding protein